MKNARSELGSNNIDLDFSFLGKSVNESSALPKHFFTDERVFDAEKEKIFRKDSIAVARVDQLANVGDYLTVDFFGDSIIVAKDKKGTINAFSNICMHRACPIAEGSGNQKSVFVCPYHKWSYGLGGELRGAPNMENAVEFEPKGQRLPGLAVELWQGFIFVNASENPKPLAPQLTEFAEKLDPWNFAELKLAGTLTYESPWNWKILLENFMESYHHMGPHTDTLEPIYPHAGTFSEKTKGQYTLLENPSVDEQASANFWVGLVFPSTMFAMTRHPDAPVVGWYQMEIQSFDQFRLHIHVLVPKNIVSNKGIVDRILATYELIHSEDIPVCDGVWQGVHSNLYEPGRLSHLEGCNWKFHHYLRDKLTA